MYIFDPNSVKYYIVVLGVGGTVLVNEPPGQATAPHVVKMVQMLAGQPPTIPGMGPEMKCREITCFSDKECVKELGDGSTCFEGICSPPPTKGGPGGKKAKGPKGPGMPGLFMINLGVVPYGAGLVSGKAYKSYAPHSYDTLTGRFISRPGPSIDAGFAGSGPSLRFNAGYFFSFGLGLTGYFRMQFLKGDNANWDDAFDLFSGGLRVNYMVVRKKLILLNVFLGGGYGHFRHKISDVPNPCYLADGSQNTTYCAPDMYSKPEKIDFWRAAGLFDLNAGVGLIIRPVDVFGITADLTIDALLPTFALNFDVTIGVAFFFGNGFKEKAAKPAEPTFTDPMMY
jgi:hypothetical protein